MTDSPGEHARAALSLFDRFDESARVVLFHGRGCAVEGRYREIRPEHLLLGALTKPVPELQSLLRARGRDPQRVHDRLRRHLLRGWRWRAAPDSDAVWIAEECKAVVLDAVKEAKARGQERFGALHLLAAVLRSPRPPWSWSSIRVRLCYEIVDLGADEVLALLGP
jgi:ATP-dependent Clp protease ATP-binding subunit ClpA